MRTELYVVRAAARIDDDAWDTVNYAVAFAVQCHVKEGVRWRVERTLGNLLASSKCYPVLTWGGGEDGNDA